jgi:predicted nucleic acid-binding Zn ribbon protein
MHLRGNKIMNITDRIDIVLNEATSTKMICRECGHKFRKKVSKKTVEVKCPKCGGYDTDVNESTVTADVAVNRAQGHVDIVNARYKKKKKKSKLTGADVVIYESKDWNYIFKGVTKTMTIKATSKKAAINKIKKEWGISNTPNNFFIWSDEEV